MHTNNNQNGNAITHPIKAMTLLVILAFGSLQLKTNGLIGELSFVTLLIVSLVSGFVVYFRDRIKKASLKDGFELYEAVREAREAEAAAKDIASAMLMVIVADPANGGDLEQYAQALTELKRLAHQRPHRIMKKAEQ
jgi:hypothetical protein